MSTRPPRRHHTVPQLYLRSFAEGNKVQWRSRTGDNELRNVANVAYEQHFYSFGPASARDVSVEHWLGKHVEDPARPVLQRTIEGVWAPPAADREVLARFVAFQLLRTPLVRRYMVTMGDTILPLLWSAERLKDAVAEGELTGPEKLQFLEQARRNTPPGLFFEEPQAMLRTMSREADRRLPELLARNWSLLRSTRRCLITSDNPVVRVFPTGAPAGFTGLSPREAELQLPLSPSVLLVLESHGLPGAAQPGTLTEQSVEIANEAQARGADRGVVHHPARAWPSALLLGRYAPQLPRPTVTTTLAEGRPPTFPATYPPPNDPEVAALLTALGAVDRVE